MAERRFVDANGLVYAHDSGSGGKHKAARALAERLWEARSGVLSTQVLQEFAVNVRRKARHPMPVAELRRTLEGSLCWTVVVNGGDATLRALDGAERHKISFWDALILDAAAQAGATLLYSEDLNHGQRYDSVQVANPFLA